MQYNITKYRNILWLLLLIAGGSHILKAQTQANDTVYLRSSFLVDLCDKKNDTNPYEGKVQLLMDLGDVKQSDSLFGYDFELRYDPELIALNAALYFNTLTEYMDERGMTFNKDSGMVLGYGLSMSIYQPVFGNRKLVAMRGDYLGTCPDTTEVNISYVEFTEEFTREINGYKSAEIISFIDYSDDRYFIIEPEKNVEIDSLGKTFADINVNTITEHDVEQFSVIINKPEGNFIIDSVNILSDKVTLVDFADNDEYYSVRFIAHNNLNEENLLRIFVSTISNTDDEEIIDINVELLDDCSCVTNIQGNQLHLKSNFVKDTSTSVQVNDNYYDYYYDSQNEIMRFEIISGNIDAINVYNIQGQLIDNIKCNSCTDITVNTHNMSAGVYVYQVITNDKIKNIFIIK